MPLASDEQWAKENVTLREANLALQHDICDLTNSNNALEVELRERHNERVVWFWGGVFVCAVTALTILYLAELASK